MVTDEMVEKAERVYWDSTNDPEGARDMRAALEAALSAAEPVGYTDASELKNKERHGLFAHVGADTGWLSGPIALYTTPPATSVAEEIADAVLSWMVKYDLLDAGNEYQAADVLAVLDDFKPSYSPAPSVAVKALEFYANPSHWKDGRFVQGEEPNVIHAIMCTIDSDQGKTARAALSTLSAQVQDVAGWHDISTAPQDGTTFLAIMAKAYSPRATLCKVEDGKFFSPSQGEKFVVPGWNQWWPTHWMPLPAAPAKQEGKP